MTPATQALLDYVTDLFNLRIPFNQVIGMQVDSLSKDGVSVHFEMKPDLVGNPAQQILHGGVTASVLDVAGSLVAIAGAVERGGEMPLERFQAKLAKVGTIDLRVDYLRPGKGERFVATAKVIRSGARVSVSRMELHNERGDHIAFGTGTYLVG